MITFYLIIRHLVLKLQIQASKALSSPGGTDAALEVAATVSVEGKVAKRVMNTRFGQRVVRQVEKEQAKSVIKKEKKLKRNKIYILIGMVVDVAIILTVVMTIISFLGMISSITTMSHLYDQTVATDNSEGEQGWHWGVGEDGMQSAGGLYPKDPKLKQLAMILEAMQIASGIANEKTGISYMNPGTLIGLTLRETGGALFNRVVPDKSLNIYSDLIYENPACGKGTRCGYIKNGLTHFEGGSVVGGVDNIDPATQIANRSISDYNKAGGDHAIGYFQIENNSIDGYLKTVFPIGKFKDTEYTDADKYKMDDIMGFIRPNIVYMPDAMINVALSNSDINTYGAGYKQAWAEIQRATWYGSLPTVDKQFCWAALKDMSYQSGPNIKLEYTASMRALLELLAAMRMDGYIEHFEDISIFMETYGQAPNLVNNTFNTTTYKISRGADTTWIKGFNKIIYDTSLKQNTRKAADKVKSTLTTGKFRTTSETNGSVLYLDIPPKSVGFVALGNKIYTIMQELIDAAEKEQSSGTLNRPVGVSKDNFKITAGKGQGLWNGKTTVELVGENSHYYKRTHGYWGTSMTLDTGKDPYNSLSSKFAVPYFSQSRSLGNEKWSGYHTGSFLLQKSGCGVYMWAYVASALQQRLINPPEMLTIGTYYGAYISGGLFNWDPIAHNKLFNSFGYKVTFYSKNQTKKDGPWDDLNQALRKNIPSGFRCDKVLTSGNSHFMVITDINDSGNYILTLTQRSDGENRTWSRAELYNIFHSNNYCLYVVDTK